MRDPKTEYIITDRDGRDHVFSSCNVEVIESPFHTMVVMFLDHGVPIATFYNPRRLYGGRFGI